MTKRFCASILVCLIALLLCGCSGLDVPMLDDFINEQDTLGRPISRISVTKQNPSDLKIEIDLADLSTPLAKEEIPQLLFDTRAFFLQDDVLETIASAERPFPGVPASFQISVELGQYQYGLSFSPLKQAGTISRMPVDEPIHQTSIFLDFTDDGVLNSELGIPFDISQFP